MRLNLALVCFFFRPETGSSRWNASRLSLSVLVLELVLLMFQTVDADSCLVSKHVDRGEFDLECPVLCHNRPNKVDFSTFTVFSDTYLT